MHFKNAQNGAWIKEKKKGIFLKLFPVPWGIKEKKEHCSTWA
jgi:hypothetical protein